MPTAVFLLATVRQTDGETQRDRQLLLLHLGYRSFRRAPDILSAIPLYGQATAAAVTVDAEAEDQATTTTNHLHVL